MGSERIYARFNKAFIKVLYHLLWPRTKEIIDLMPIIFIYFLFYSNDATNFLSLSFDLLLAKAKKKKRQKMKINKFQ